MAVDSQGNLFIVESNAEANRVRKVTPSGIISTVAGRTGLGFSGDGGPATSALLDGPEGVAVDSAGNIFIADTQNNRVRQVNASGTITTVAGHGGAGNSGDGGLPVNANLTPGGLTLDSSGNLYIGRIIT